MKTIIAIATLLFISSCTVTKRQYLGGYHVEWKKHFSKDKHQTTESSISTNSLDEMKSVSLQDSVIHSTGPNQTAIETEETNLDMCSPIDSNTVTLAIENPQKENARRPFVTTIKAIHTQEVQRIVDQFKPDKSKSKEFHNSTLKRALLTSLLVISAFFLAFFVGLFVGLLFELVIPGLITFGVISFVSGFFIGVVNRRKVSRFDTKTKQILAFVALGLITCAIAFGCLYLLGILL